MLQFRNDKKEKKKRTKLKIQANKNINNYKEKKLESETKRELQNVTKGKRIIIGLGRGGLPEMKNE